MPPRPAHAPWIVCAAALALWALAIAPLGHYSGDAGAKLTQSHDLWASGLRSRALRYDTTLGPIPELGRLSVQQVEIVYAPAAR